MGKATNDLSVHYKNGDESGYKDTVGRRQFLAVTDSLVAHPYLQNTAV